MLIWELLTGPAYPLPGSSTPRLDKELLLAKVLRCSREWLCMNSAVAFSVVASADQQQQWEEYYRRRLAGEPIAYLLGYQDFWRQRLLVTPDVLIPRPETEGLVELVLREAASAAVDVLESVHDGARGCMHNDVTTKAVTERSVVVADLGTGSGAISIALASERPHWQLIASDFSERALAIARLNVQRCGINNVRLLQSDWLSAFDGVQKLDAIVANPPYLAVNDPHLQDSIRFEPSSALVADQDGLADIFAIITQAKKYLKSGGLLAIEHGYQQADVVRRFWQEDGGYDDVMMECDLAGQPRISWARRR